MFVNELDLDLRVILVFEAILDFEAILAILAIWVIGKFLQNLKVRAYPKLYAKMSDFLESPEHSKVPVQENFAFQAKTV